MNIGGFKITFPFWSRNASGDNFYDITEFDNWSSFSSNLSIAQNHPILTPALLFVAKLFSQANIRIINERTGEEATNHPLADVLRKPNFYQTLPDLLETLSFMQLANGAAVLYKKKVFGTDIIEGLYLLDYNLIHFPEEIKKNYIVGSARAKSILEKEVIYDERGQNIKIKLKDLMFFYDPANGVDSNNPFKVRSRIDGLKQTLINTNDSLIAKNIILRSNGKEMLSGSKEGFPLTPEEKRDAEELFNARYGLSPARKRGLITRANVTWKSLHIALRDLGLDESVKVDGNIIYTALHIPKDILSLEAKKTTYNNFKESMMSYIQNEMQSTLNSVIATMSCMLEDGFRLEGDYNHLPVMQYAVYEKYKGIKMQAEALDALRKAGLPDDVALQKSGFNPKIKLNPIVNEESREKRREENATKTSIFAEEESWN